MSPKSQWCHQHRNCQWVTKITIWCGIHGSPLGPRFRVLSVLVWSEVLKLGLIRMSLIKPFDVNSLKIIFSHADNRNDQIFGWNMTGNRLPNSMKSLTVSLAGFKESGGNSLYFPTIKKVVSLTALNGSID